MVSKSFVQSFSYPASDVAIVEAAERLAKSDNVPFSQLILRLLKEEVRQKNVIGGCNPINIGYGNEPKKYFQSDLTIWFKHIDEVESQQELQLLKGQVSALGKKVDKRSMELYKNGIRH